MSKSTPFQEWTAKHVEVSSEEAKRLAESAWCDGYECGMNTIWEQIASLATIRTLAGPLPGNVALVPFAALSELMQRCGVTELVNNKWQK